MLAYNPAKDAEKPSKTNPTALYLDADGDAEELKAIASGSSLYVPIVVALGSGIRRGELCAPRRRDVDLEKGMLTVRELLECRGKLLRFKRPKNNTTRVVDVADDVMPALRSHQTKQKEQFLKLGARVTG